MPAVKPKPRPNVLPPAMRTEKFRDGFAAVIGIIGGAQIAVWAGEYLREVTQDDETASKVVTTCALVAAAGGLAWMLDLDEKWTDVTKLAAAIEKEIPELPTGWSMT